MAGVSKVLVGWPIILRIIVLDKKGKVVKTIREAKPRTYVGKLTLPGQASRLTLPSPDTTVSSEALNPVCHFFGF